MQRWPRRIRGAVGTGLAWAIAGAAIIGVTTLFSASAAAGSLVLARLGEKRALLNAGEDAAEAG